MTPDYDWQSLHRDALVIDSHNDTSVGLIRRGEQSVASRLTGQGISRSDF